MTVDNAQLRKFAGWVIDNPNEAAGYLFHYHQKVEQLLANPGSIKEQNRLLSVYLLFKMELISKGVITK